MPARDKAHAAPRWKRLKRAVGLLFAGGLVVGVCAAVRFYWDAGPATAQAPRGARGAAAAQPAANAQPQKLAVVAVVNGEEVKRGELARDCLRRYGGEVLDSLTNKHLIAAYCRRQGISVTQQEVDAEIAHIAGRFRVPREEWLQMLHQERGISTEQYASDIIWPTLALRKAAKETLQISQQEIQAAYETHYGPAVEARMIVCATRKKAETVLAQAHAQPAEFGKLAKQHSDDAYSAKNEGIMMPIRKHLGDAAIEKAAYQLKPGQVSQIIRVGQPGQAGLQYVILKCERQVPARYQRFPLQGEIRERIVQSLREKKERVVAAQMFDKLRKGAKIIVVLGDKNAELRYPGVAAFVNNQAITRPHLAEECLRRHGVEVLEALINRKILVQKCRAAGVQVAQPDIDAEIARAADAMGVVDANNRPDVAAWLKVVQKDQGLSVDRYVDDIVWPTVALKKYVAKKSPDNVKVTPDDLRKGFEASFGRRVRCKAIVLYNQRTADEVWKMANENRNATYFGELASKYSIERGSAMLRGDVPPIQQFGGRPLLEREAFKLQPNELSGVIQVGDKFVILFCTGFEPPAKVKFEEVRDEIYADLYEKKLRIEMAKSMDHMLESARYENYLANTRHAPATAGAKNFPPRR